MWDFTRVYQVLRYHERCILLPYHHSHLQNHLFVCPTIRNPLLDIHMVPVDEKLMELLTNINVRDTNMSNVRDTTFLQKNFTNC